MYMCGWKSICGMFSGCGGWLKHFLVLVQYTWYMNALHLHCTYNLWKSNKLCTMQSVYCQACFVESSIDMDWLISVREDIFWIWVDRSIMYLYFCMFFFCKSWEKTQILRYSMSYFYHFLFFWLQGEQGERGPPGPVGDQVKQLHLNSHLTFLEHTVVNIWCNLLCSVLFYYAQYIYI